MGKESLKDYLIKHEGIALKPYPCSKGYLTIGVGRNLDKKGISKEEALFMFENDIRKSLDDLRIIFSDWDSISSDRQMVLVDMRFQLGHRGFRGFKKFIAAVKMRDWKLASVEILDSSYAKQVPRRAKENVELILEQ